MKNHVTGPNIQPTNHPFPGQNIKNLWVPSSREEDMLARVVPVPPAREPIRPIEACHGGMQSMLKGWKAAMANMEADSLTKSNKIKES